MSDPELVPHPAGPRPRWRRLLALAATVLVAVGVGGMWFGSRLPATYSMATMGYPDFGGGTAGAHGHDGPGMGGTSIATLVANPDRPADVEMDLVAREGEVALADGRVIDGFSLNGTTPGPTITAAEGDLVEVRLRNENVADGITLHWHGVDVPNAMDGVAGVTQDAVPPGETQTYRFVADTAGTYWYHSHQQSNPQVLGGLLGAIVITPAAGPDEEAAGPDEALEVPALVHFYDGVRTINGAAGDVRVDAAPGATARVRIINTDNGPMPVWVPGASFRVLAVDGTDVVGPTPVREEGVLVTAGGRADLEVRVPVDGSAARVQLAGASLLIGAGEGPTAPAPRTFVDFLGYGSPAPLAFDPAKAARHFEYAIGRRFGLLDGRPGLWWTINGHMFPDVPMFLVEEGDIVTLRISNSSGQVHPMHLHGHHAVVLARDGVAASGSPWVVDSLNVENGETYDIAFVADNPGIWMDHCHNLPHAAQGLMTHLAYLGYDTPFAVGGDHANHPE